MQILQKCTLAWLFLCCVMTLTDSQPVRAEPIPPDPEKEPCDKKCRARQFFYFVDGFDYGGVKHNYRKYELATCEFCHEVGLCGPGGNDTNIEGKCTTKAGGEFANKWWVVASKSVCDHTTEKYIEAEKGEPTNKDAWTATADKFCK